MPEGFDSLTMNEAEGIRLKSYVLLRRYCVLGGLELNWWRYREVML